MKLFACLLAVFPAPIFAQTALEFRMGAMFCIADQARYQDFLPDESLRFPTTASAEIVAWRQFGPRWAFGTGIGYHCFSWKNKFVGIPIAATAAQAGATTAIEPVFAEGVVFYKSAHLEQYLSLPVCAQFRPFEASEIFQRFSLSLEGRALFLAKGASAARFRWTGSRPYRVYPALANEVGDYLQKQVRRQVFVLAPGLCHEIALPRPGTFLMIKAAYWRSFSGLSSSLRPLNGFEYSMGLRAQI